MLEQFESKYITILERDTNNINFQKIQETLKQYSQDFLKMFKSVQKMNAECEIEKERQILKTKDETKKLIIQSEKTAAFLLQTGEKLDTTYKLLEELKRDLQYSIEGQPSVARVEDMYNRMEDLVAKVFEMGANYGKEMDYELELQKYEDKILRMDQELELAKHTILHYMKSVDTLEGMLQNVMEQNGLKETPEMATLKAELEHLKEQNDNLLKTKRSMEEHHRSQLSQIQEFFQRKFQSEGLLSKKIEQLGEIFTQCRNQDLQEIRSKVSRDDFNRGMMQRMAVLDRFLMDLKGIIARGQSKAEGNQPLNIIEEIKYVQNEELELLRSQINMFEEKDSLIKDVIL